MIDPSTFAARWQNLPQPSDWPGGLVRPDDLLALVKADEQVVQDRTLPSEAKHFLVAGGLPESAAPFLSFKDVAKGLLRIWQVYGTATPQFWKDEDRLRLQSFCVIGSDGAGNPICLDEQNKGCVVLLDHEDNFRTITFMNSGVTELAACLLAFRDASNQAQLIDELQRIDPACMSEGCFWRIEASNIEDDEDT
jgi:hypothetical protein